LNLSNIVGPIVSAVNPWITAQLQQSQGYTTAADGSRQPKYGSPVPMPVQMQALQYNDLMQVSSLNIQGERRALYINGDWEAVVRSDQEGGDLVTLPDCSVWLVVFQFENWFMTGGWVKVAITRQNSR
jgi:hypothetical protein